MTSIVRFLHFCISLSEHVALAAAFGTVTYLSNQHRLFIKETFKARPDAYYFMGPELIKLPQSNVALLP